MDIGNCSCYVYVIKSNLESQSGNWTEVRSGRVSTFGKFNVTIGSAQPLADANSDCCCCKSEEPNPLVFANNDCKCCQSSTVLIFDRSVAVEDTSSLREISQMPPLNGVTINRTDGNQWTITIDPSEIPNAVYREFQNGNNTAICISYRTLDNRTVATAQSTTHSTTAASHLNSNSVIPESIRTWFTTYQAVIIIVIVSSISTFISPLDGMDTFMGVYMMLFACLQLQDIHETATRLGRYDILAKTNPIMGYLIPVMNLLLGFSHLTTSPSVIQSLITGLFSSIKAVGPWNAMFRNEKIDCGCVGSSGNMRVGVVTFLEEAFMALLCAIQLHNMLMDDEGSH